MNFLYSRFHCIWIIRAVWLTSKIFPFTASKRNKVKSKQLLLSWFQDLFLDSFNMSRSSFPFHRIFNIRAVWSAVNGFSLQSVREKVSQKSRETIEYDLFLAEILNSHRFPSLGFFFNCSDAWKYNFWLKNSNLLLQMVQQSQTNLLKHFFFLA